MNPPTLIILRGLPGSGKSTAAQLLATIPGAVALCADDFPGRYVIDDGSPCLVLGAPALEWCRQETERRMYLGTPVIIVHNVFPSQRMIQEYADLAQHYGYRLIVLRAEGAFGSVHNVPEETLERMKKDFEPWPP